MPNIPGSVFNPKTRKYDPPPGHVRQATAKKATKDNKKKAERAEQEMRRQADPGPLERSRGLERLRQQEAMDITYAVFALYPGQPRAWIGYVNDPTHATVQAAYGGGKYQLVPVDRGTNLPSGEPMDLNIDLGRFPARLPGFMGANQAGTFQGAGFGGMPYGAQGFAGGYPPPPPPPVKNASAEEVEDLEEEVDELKAQLITMTRERDQARMDMAAEKERSARVEADAKMEARFASLTAALTGNRKDPLDQLLEFKRVEAELNPAIGRTGGPGETMGALMQLFDMVVKAKDKFGEPESGGAANGFVEALKSLSPILEKMADNAAAAKAKPAAQPLLTERRPVPLQAAAADVPKEEAGGEEVVVPAVVSEAAGHLFTYLSTSHTAGVSPVQAAEWITSQKEAGWPEVHAAINEDSAETFLEIIKDRIPDAVVTQPQRAWVLETIRSTKERLSDKNT